MDYLDRTEETGNGAAKVNLQKKTRHAPECGTSVRGCKVGEMRRKEKKIKPQKEL